MTDGAMRHTVECWNGQEWVALCTTGDEAKAKEVADFMLRGAAKPSDVRITTQ